MNVKELIKELEKQDLEKDSELRGVFESGIKLFTAAARLEKKYPKRALRLEF